MRDRIILYRRYSYCLMDGQLSTVAAAAAVQTRSSSLSVIFGKGKLILLNRTSVGKAPERRLGRRRGTILVGDVLYKHRRRWSSTKLFLWKALAFDWGEPVVMNASGWGGDEEWRDPFPSFIFYFLFYISFLSHLRTFIARRTIPDGHPMMRCAL